MCSEKKCERDVRRGVAFWVPFLIDGVKSDILYIELCKF